MDQQVNLRNKINLIHIPENRKKEETFTNS